MHTGITQKMRLLMLTAQNMNLLENTLMSNQGDIITDAGITSQNLCLFFIYTALGLKYNTLCTTNATSLYCYFERIEYSLYNYLLHSTAEVNYTL